MSKVTFVDQKLKIKNLIEIMDKEKFEIAICLNNKKEVIGVF